MLLSIRLLGDPILRKKAEPVTVFDEALKELVSHMIETIDAVDGLGIAAPQVGHSIRVFVLRNYIELENGRLTLSEPKVYVNPKLKNPSLETCSDVEGCLSIPEIRAQVIRPVSITVEAFDVHGIPFTEEVHGYNARSRMHENDHLNGVLFIDRLDAKEKKRVRNQLEKIESKKRKAS